MSRQLLNVLGLVLVCAFPAVAFAVDGGDVLVADTRKLHGWELWWAGLYNGSHLTFTLVTIVFVPLAGVILGTLADLVMSRLGIDLKKRVLAEH